MGNHLVMRAGLGALVLLLAGCELIANIPNPSQRSDDGGGTDGPPPDGGDAGPGVRCENDNDCVDSASEDNVCLLPQGTCVECVDASQCGASEPVCASNACRACIADADCGANAACLVDGTCAGEARIAFASPTGSGTACSAAAPCTPQQAVASLTVARDVLKLAAASYSFEAALRFELPGIPLVTVAGEGATFTTTGMFNSAVTVAAGSVDVIGVRFDAGFGGADCTGGRLALHGVVLAGNVFGAFGSNGCQLVVERSLARGNTVYAIGGGSNATVTIRNSAVVENGNASNNLAPIYVPGANGIVEHTTIANNLGDGTSPSVICDTATTVPFVVKSSISFGHGAAIPSACVVTYSNIEAGYGGAGANNVTIDPMFLAGDYHIGPTSPMRGAGDPASTVRIDFDGEARPNPAGTPPDIGADEVP